jgi:hypothetical protein
MSSHDSWGEHSSDQDSQRRRRSTVFQYFIFCLFVELTVMFSASFDLAARRKNRHRSAALQKP